MIMKFFQLIFPLFFLSLSSCGYKGDLHLPQPDEDYSKYGPIQTGTDLKPLPPEKEEGHL